MTEEQLEKIKRNRKNKKPSYFNSDINAEVEITNDFEAFLILLDDAQKQNTITQLKASISASTPRKDRDELLNLALASELSDSDTIYAEVAKEFSDFDTFLKKFKLDGFDTISEIGLLISDIQTAMGERLLLRDRMEHLNIFIKVLTSSLSPNTIKDTKIKEINSWITVISSYKGIK